MTEAQLREIWFKHILTDEPMGNFSMDRVLSAMREVIQVETKKVNEFISDIAKLLGEDDLGFDGKSWTIDDFKNAITEAMRLDSIGFANWLCHKWYFHEGHWTNAYGVMTDMTTEKLYNEFLNQ